MYSRTNLTKAVLAALTIFALGCQPSNNSTKDSTAKGAESPNITGTQTAMTGGTSGGGGKGVVCRDFRGEIKSVELLDLWEARVLHHLTLIPAKGTVDEQVKAALKILGSSVSWEAPDMDKKSISENAHNSYDFMMSEVAEPLLDPSRQKAIWQSGLNLTITPDSYENATPAGCTIEQIVRYSDLEGGVSFAHGEGDGASSYYSGVLGNLDLFKKMNDQNKAALIAHESFYFYLRELDNEADSIRVRRAIGLAFSGAKMSTFSYADLTQQYLSCADDYYKSVAFINSDGTTLILRAGGLLLLNWTKESNAYNVFQQYNDPYNVFRQNNDSGVSLTNFPQVFKEPGKMRFGGLSELNDFIQGDYPIEAVIASDGKTADFYIHVMATPTNPKGLPADKLKCVLKSKDDAQSKTDSTSSGDSK